MAIFVRHTNPVGNVRGTYAGLFNEETGELFISVARCSNKDHFVKRIGYNIATGRVSKNTCVAKINTFDFEDAKQHFHAFVDKHSETLIYNKNVNQLIPEEEIFT